MPKERRKDVDIFSILTETAEKDKKTRREELLAPLGVREYFVEGRITINKRTCEGVDCKLCIKACPTSALYWKAGHVGVTEELCIYCGACVLSCMVDDCITIRRKRSTGEVEVFSKPKEFAALQQRINDKRRHVRIREVFPEAGDYIRYRKKKQRHTSSK